MTVQALVEGLESWYDLGKNNETILARWSNFAGLLHYLSKIWWDLAKSWYDIGKNNWHDYGSMVRF